MPAFVSNVFCVDHASAAEHMERVVAHGDTRPMAEKEAMEER